VLESEEQAACSLGPDLLARATRVTGKLVRVALAVPKFEAWLVASSETLQLADLAFDEGRDPVVVIKERLPSKYIKPIWQPRLTNRMDLPLACGRSASLRRTLARFDELRALV